MVSNPYFNESTLSNWWASNVSGGAKPTLDSYAGEDGTLVFIDVNDNNNYQHQQVKQSCFKESFSRNISKTGKKRCYLGTPKTFFCLCRLLFLCFFSF